MAAPAASSMESDSEWARHREKILDSYLTKRLTLKELAERMRKDHGFIASTSQFEAQLQAWQARKNLKAHEWKPVLDRLDSLPREIKSRVIISGRPISKESLLRARRYCKSKYRHSRNPHSQEIPNNNLGPTTIVEQVSIETQDLNGTWSRLDLSSNNSLGALGIHKPVLSPGFQDASQPSPREHIGLEARQDSGSTSPAHASLDPKSSNFKQKSSHPANLPTLCIMLYHPSFWLEDLPSRTIWDVTLLHLTRQSSHVNLTSTSYSHDMSKTAITEIAEAMKSSPWFEDFLSLPGLMSLLPGQDFRAEYEQSRGPLSMPNVLETNLVRLLMYTLVNGYVGPENIPAESLAKLFARSQSVNSLWSQLLHAGSKHAVRSLVQNVFQAAIQCNESLTVARILEMGLAHVNDTLAAKFGHVETMKALIHAGADINKTNDREYSIKGGALGKLIYYLQQHSNESRPDLVEFAKQLLSLGAIVPLNGIMCLETSKLDNSLLYSLISSISPSQHSYFLDNCLFGTPVVLALEDEGAAVFIARLLENSFKKGRYHVVRSLLPHASSSSDLSNRALCAAIQCGNDDLISFIMAKRPNVNPPAYSISAAREDTTPLAEAIKAKNQLLINAFEQVGVLRSLHRGRRFQAAVAAAVEVGDLSFATKLLECYPELDFQGFQDSLSVVHPVRANDERLLTSLLERDAINVSSQNLLGVAISQKNEGMVRFMLKAGAVASNSENMETLGKALEWGDKSIITDLLTTFHCPSRFKTQLCCQDQARILRNILGNAATSELVLNSKLATRQFLTDCLLITTQDEDYETMQCLLRAGADASNEYLLEFAAEWHPKMLPILLETLERPKAIVTKGMRSGILRAAIRGGPSALGNVKTILNSRTFDKSDISDTGDLFSHVTPLGEAIALNKMHPDLSCEILSLLLDAGGDPNSIVTWLLGPGGRRVNQTALLAAIETESKGIINLLIQHGARINAEIPYLVRRTPLQKAAEIGSLDITRLLLEHGADVNAEPSFFYGGTALQFAAISGNCNIAAELLTHGASLYMAPSKIGGRFPLEGAAEHDRLDMVEFLWRANQETVILEDIETGFEEKHCRKAMRLAEKNGHMACRDLVAELSGLPIIADQVPPAVSPIYIDWPPQHLSTT
ncbi:hypothetical protein F5X99DRAFT_432219 [Biscogniauxia marginata]|nr:hypothetical protein F5X99DRAFT_432219 [Biscogniauxia marginata]